MNSHVATYMITNYGLHVVMWKFRGGSVALQLRGQKTLQQHLTHVYET